MKLFLRLVVLYSLTLHQILNMMLPVIINYSHNIVSITQLKNLAIISILTIATISIESIARIYQW